MRNNLNKNNLRMIELHWRELLIALISFVFLEIFFQTFSPEFMQSTIFSIPLYIPLFIVVSYITGIVYCKESNELTDAPLDEDTDEQEVAPKSTYMRVINLSVLYYCGQFAISYLMFPSFLEYKLFGIPFFNFVFTLNILLIYNLYKKLYEEIS